MQTIENPTLTSPDREPRPPPRQAFAVNETFTDISLNDATCEADERHDAMKSVTATSTSPLFQKMSCQATGFSSLPQSGGKRSVSYCGSSWEANKDLDEQTFGSHVMKRENMLSHHHRQQRSIRLEELEENYPSSTATVSQDSLRSVFKIYFLYKSI